MIYTAEDGPQPTASEAYGHASDLATALAERAKKKWAGLGAGPVYVRVEEVEHLAAGLAARAEEAR